MKLVVGYLATPGGADAMALGVRLARTLGAEIEACIVLPAERGLPSLSGTRAYEAKLGEQAEKWLAEALASVPDDLTAHSHVSFDDSFADGRTRETARLEAEIRPCHPGNTAEHQTTTGEQQQRRRDLDDEH